VTARGGAPLPVALTSPGPAEGTPLADDRDRDPGPEPSTSLTRQLLGAALVHTLAHSVGAAVLLRASATIVTQGWPEVGVLGALGAWSLIATYTAVGFAGGALLGALSGAAAGVHRIEREVRGLIERPPPEGRHALLPSVPLSALEADYARVLDATVDGTLGRLPLPARLRRFVRARMRPPLVDDFLETARRTGRTSAGFPELRDWLLLRGLPWVTAPLLGPLRVWRSILAGGLLTLAALPLAVAVAAGLVGARVAVIGTCSLAALVTLLLGLRVELRGRDPRIWRRGIVTLAVQMVVWPGVWSALWGTRLGAVWIPMFVVTLLGVRWSLRQAFVRAGPALPSLPPPIEPSG
jgi:hypothetical protein